MIVIFAAVLKLHDPLGRNPSALVQYMGPLHFTTWLHMPVLPNAPEVNLSSPKPLSYVLADINLRKIT